jgi:hypothetical protein
LRGIALGSEIMVIVVAWTLSGWFLGNSLTATWPLAAFSIAGVSHALYHFLKSARKL